MRTVYAAAAALLIFQPAGTAQTEAAEAPRSVVVVSDLHFGLGCPAGAACSPYEDFRWTEDLRGFLASIDRRGNGRTDLLIAGDLLELWQRPPGISCQPPDEHPDFGCSPKEVDELVKRIVEVHQPDLHALGEFASRRDNRLFIIPGNHDAGLLDDGAWLRVLGALRVPPSRAILVASGRWLSADGRIAVEHGHQIGRDVNRFPEWPEVTRIHLREERLVRTWGEQFVQQLYNEVEASYPLIDNVQPVGAGVRLYRTERGYVGTGKDAAKFLAFNLFGTSIAQRISLGGNPDEQTDGICWDSTPARERGARLLADSLEPGHPARRALLDPSGDDERELSAEVDALIRDPVAYPEEDILALCDAIALLRVEESPTGESGRTTCEQCSATLGLSVAQEIVPENRVLSRHLRSLHRVHPELRLFIYGHTHEARVPWTINVRGAPVTVANSGAFQRLIDQDGLERLADSEKTTPQRIFAEYPLESLPACYSAVLVHYEGSRPKAETRNWYVDPATGEGELVDACDPRCGYRNPKSCG